MKATINNKTITPSNDDWPNVVDLALNTIKKMRTLKEFETIRFSDEMEQYIGDYCVFLTRSTLYPYIHELPKFCDIVISMDVQDDKHGKYYTVDELSAMHTQPNIIDVVFEAYHKTENPVQLIFDTQRGLYLIVLAIVPLLASRTFEEYIDQKENPKAMKDLLLHHYAITLLHFIRHVKTYYTISTTKDMSPLYTDDLSQKPVYDILSSERFARYEDRQHLFNKHINHTQTLKSEDEIQAIIKQDVRTVVKHIIMDVLNIYGMMFYVLHILNTDNLTKVEITTSEFTK